MIIAVSIRKARIWLNIYVSA